MTKKKKISDPAYLSGYIPANTDIPLQQQQTQQSIIKENPKLTLNDWISTQGEQIIISAYTYDSTSATVYLVPQGYTLYLFSASISCASNNTSDIDLIRGSLIFSPIAFKNAFLSIKMHSFPKNTQILSKNFIIPIKLEEGKSFDISADAKMGVTGTVYGYLIPNSLKFY